MESTTRQFADAHGRQLHARVWEAPAAGAGRTPVVLLHDSLGAVELWRDFPGLLAAHLGRRVVAYDRAGFGKSQARHAPIGQTFIHDEAGAALQPLLDILDIEQAILFGHSVGGGMAVSAAAQFPGRIAAVITESAQAFVEDRTLEGIRAAQRNFADPAQVARLAKYHGNDAAKAQWVLDAWIATWLAPGFAGWSLDAALAQLRCPVLAMHGDQDEFGSALHPQKIAGQGRGECLMLDGCGHVPHREQPQRVLQAVGDFLRGRFQGK